MTGKALNLRNVSPELIRALHERAAEEKMHLREFCISLLEKGVLPQEVVEMQKAVNANLSTHIEMIDKFDKPPQAPPSDPPKRFPKDVPILCTKCKKVPMRARDENTWRCPLCGHQEAR